MPTESAKFEVKVEQHSNEDIQHGVNGISEH